MDILKNVVLNLHTQRFEEDIIDRWNFQWTAYVFAFSSLIITSNTYMGKPITCWTPAEFRDGWNEYARDYCLIENTYYVPMDDPTMPQHYVREKEELPYYQWVQFVLVLLAFLFFIPHLLWRSLNWWSGIQVRAVVQACARLPVDEKKRNEELDKISAHIHRSIFKTRILPQGIVEKVTFASGWVCAVYLVMKTLFIVNIVLQLVVLHIFLGFDWTDLFSIQLSFNTDWKSTGLFPRSTMCDFEIRNKGNLQRYSVQCVLSQNMFNEKIFLVLFYWLIALFVITLSNSIVWVSQIASTANRKDFADRMLESAGVVKPTTERGSNEFSSFTDLPVDCLVLLRLISSNAGDSVCSDVTKRLYYLCITDTEHRN